MTGAIGGQRVLLAERLGVLALGADLGMGQPMDHALAQCLLSFRIGERLGLGDEERGVLYYVSLLAWVGWHIDAYEQAKWFGDFTDLKSPYKLGHTRAVTELATASASALSWSGDEITHIRRAALLHDLGRLGISNAIWDKPGPLSSAEAERIRLHPYLTERMLASSPALAPLGTTAAQHHERIDGSGYPRNLRGDSMSPTGKLLAAADAYAGKLEPRPHRPATRPDVVKIGPPA